MCILNFDVMFGDSTFSVDLHTLLEVDVWRGSDCRLVWYMFQGREYGRVLENDPCYQQSQVVEEHIWGSYFYRQYLMQNNHTDCRHGTRSNGLEYTAANYQLPYTNQSRQPGLPAA